MASAQPAERSDKTVGGATSRLEEDLVVLLRRMDQPLERAARELMILELYRRGDISSGKAVELLGMPLATFLEYASHLGIPVLSMTAEEWKYERSQIEAM